MDELLDQLLDQDTCDLLGLDNRDYEWTWGIVRELLHSATSVNIFLKMQTIKVEKGTYL